MYVWVCFWWLLCLRGAGVIGWDWGITAVFTAMRVVHATHVHRLLDFHSKYYSSNIMVSHPIHPFIDLHTSTHCQPNEPIPIPTQKIQQITQK